jgi:DNA-binding MarR family transcriptional regulator
VGSKPSALQRELAQNKPFSSLSDEGSVAILRTADVLRRAFSQVLAAHDITLAQYNVLRILRGAGPAGLPTLEVAARLIETAPGITVMMNRLLRRRWVRRRRDRRDRRRVLCFLTDAGAALLSNLDAPFQAAGDRALAALSAAEQKRLITMLEAIRRDHGERSAAAKEESS